MRGLFSYIATALLASACTARAASTPKHHDELVSSPGDRAVIPGWHFQSTKKAVGALEKMSSLGVDTSGWHRMGPRGTVMAGLVESGVYDEESLFFSDNLLTLVDRTPFDAPWLFREEFELDPRRGQRYFLETHGITSRADIYINGRVVASKDVQVGSFGGHKYDVTKYVQDGKNCLLVQVHPTNYLRDLAIGFIDWNPYPPDNGTGIWRNVEFSQTGPIAIMGPTRVATDFKGPEAQKVKVTVKVDVKNNLDKPVRGEVKGYIQQPNKRHGIRIAQKIRLEANEERTVSLDAVIHEPQIWWPAHWGEQPLYKVSLKVDAGGALSDKAVDSRFGIRNVESVVRHDERRSFTVNGKPFLVMGAGYTSHIFLRLDMEKVRTQFQYVLDMGLNTIRLEGKQEHPEFYDLADEMGLMIIIGWDCCDKWEGWEYNNEAPGVEIWGDEDYKTAGNSLRHEASMTQSHPCMLAFLAGSDFWPDDRATKIYLDVLERMDWQVPVVSSAAKRGYPEAMGPSGMDMDGPYDWIPPNYWYGDKLGAAIGFGSELGAGVGSPGLRSMKKFLSESDLEDLWTEPEKQLFHLSRNGGMFDNRRIYNEALYARYGQPRDLDDYLLKSDLMDYEATRAEFEAYSAWKSNENPSTGLIYWMLNGAWPNLHWSLFDYYMNPIASYFGTKVGTRTEHVAYDYQAQTVYIINHSLDRQGPRKVSIDLIDMNGKSLASDEINTKTQPNSSKKLGKVPGISKIQDVGFLRLTLSDAKTGKQLSRTVHWLAPTVDVLAWDNSTWYHTPVSQYVDFTSLSSLAPADVKVEVHSRRKGPDVGSRVVLKNKSDVPAFFIKLAAVDVAADEEVSPVFWSDNYVSLWPGEEVEVDLRFGKKRCGGVGVEFRGYNVERNMVNVC